jgi:hypothetical protein
LSQKAKVKVKEVFAICLLLARNLMRNIETFVLSRMVQLAAGIIYWVHIWSAFVKASVGDFCTNLAKRTVLLDQRLV